jgi:hypothetical protein
MSTTPTQNTCEECANDYTVGKRPAGADRISWAVSPQQEIHAQKTGWCSVACKHKTVDRERASQLRQVRRELDHRKSEN